MKTMIRATVAALSISIAAFAAEKEAAMAKFTLTSPSFRNDQPMPGRHTCEGVDSSSTLTWARKDASPALKWEGAPTGTKSFALICDDPDAPGGSWVHWLLYGIPASVSELPVGIETNSDVVVASWPPSQKMAGWRFVAGSGLDGGNLPGAKQGINDFGKSGYGGPCPPRGHGVHHYHFRLYALDTELNLAPRVSRRQLEAAMKGHIVAQTELVGTYRRD